MNNNMQNIINKYDALPAMPNVVMKALNIIKTENSGLKELAKIISYDHSLTTEVLKLVNSAYYGLPKQITSIQNAISLLGFNEIRKTVIAITLKPILTSRGGRDLWEHSIISAVACEMLAKQVNIIKPEDAFVVAFLHDIGKIVLNHSSPIAYNKVKTLVAEGNNILEVENLLIGTTHTDVGFKLAKKWQLPVIIANCIKYHHNPIQSSISNVVGLVMYADIIAHCDYTNKNIDSIKKLTRLENDTVDALSDAIFEQASKLIESIN